MKRFTFVFSVLVFICASAASGQSGSWGMSDGSFALSAGIGSQMWFEGVDAYPGVEYIFAKADIGGIGFSFGAAGRGAVYVFEDTYFAASWNEIVIGGAILGTAHLGLSQFAVPKVIARADIYVASGVRYLKAIYGDGYDSSYGESNYDGFGFAALLGIDYYLTERLAVQLEGYHYGYNGLLLGLLYRW